MRPKVKEEHPEMSLSERSKLVGKMWANLKPEKKQVCRLLLSIPTRIGALCEKGYICGQIFAYNVM